MSGKLTPLLTQYHRIKEKHKGAILLFRVGDFYEMFYEDAEVGSKALGLALTSRPHGPDNRVPLAGVPAKSLDTYVGRLVAQGFKVAICDQLDQPSRDKPVVRREVVEIVTPGTLTRPGLLDETRNNYLMAISPAGETCGIAFADVSTGEFRAAETNTRTLGEEMQKIEPREVLVPQSWKSENTRLPVSEITRIDDYYFTEDFAFDKLTSHFGVATLEGFGIAELTEGICAAGAVLYYLEQTQKSALPHIRKISPYNTANHLLVDRISRRNLELVQRLHPIPGARKTGTLLSVLDRTRTSAGTRMLRRWVLAPLLDTDIITERQDAVEELASTDSPVAEIQGLLKKTGDLERVSSRIALERANPRELVALKNWLKVAPDIKQIMARCHAARLTYFHSGIEDFSELVADIEETLTPDPPVTLTEGGLIRPGHHPELDKLRNLSRNVKQYIAGLQEKERQRTAIPNLRVGFNSVFGYYIEVTKSYLKQVPKNYLRKQTLTNAERFITPELKEYETKVINAEERINTLEYELFTELRQRVGKQVGRVIKLSGILAELDVLSSFAQVTCENRYTRPKVDNSEIIEITKGRHPVAETTLDRPFIPNATNLDTEDQQILIITGPNMAGKSTYLRQVALITIMAQIGSFVPVEKARIGVVDKIFTRIGATDDVTQGVSTFLAEMTETANILNNATSRSLVILDEVGRGTATNDGLAIAWATVEYLHGPKKRRPRTLFATHYHKLTDIALLLLRVHNYNFSVKENHDHVLFLRKLKPGPASKSYGIAVARLAGLPLSVIERARQVLADFEKDKQTNLTNLLLSSEQLLAADRPSSHPVLSKLCEAKIDDMSPVEALNLLAKLQHLAQKDTER